MYYDICDVIHAYHAKYSDPEERVGRNSEVRALQILIL